MKVSHSDAISLSKLTKGYSYAYQLLGYLMYESNKKELDSEILKEFDKYLREYVYEKIYYNLLYNEKIIINAVSANEEIRVSDILKITKIKKENFSQYRDKLIKKGILISVAYGKLEFILPRFKEYVKLQTEFEEDI